MSRRAVVGLLCLAAAVSLPDRATRAEGEASAVSALLGDLKSPDFDRAYQAVERLRQYPAERAQIVPALIEALGTREWSRCGADVRDAIARRLEELGAREAVPPLLEVVRSGRAIEHECVE